MMILIHIWIICMQSVESVTVQLEVEIFSHIRICSSFVTSYNTQAMALEEQGTTTLLDVI